jgi:arylsulfatase A-like enzyme
MHLEVIDRSKKMISFIAILFSSMTLGSSIEAVERRPNVVILLTDDQGTLDARCFGSTDLVTPNIDRLAATGIRFTQAYAHTVCCPARAALMTGRHPQRSGIVNWTQGDRHGSDLPKINMDTAEITIAEVMKAAGYRTALFGKWHLGAKVGHGPLDQGFDTFFGHLGGFIDNYRHYFLHSKGFHDLWDGNEEIFRRDEYYPDLLVSRVVKFIEANKSEPFFVTVTFNLPHYPEQPTVKFQDAYLDMPMPRRSYARVVSSVDEHIGRILDQLETTGLRDNTIVILMSDNGHSVENNAGISVDNHSSGYPRGHYYLAHGGGGNTGKWIGNKGTFLEGGIRVPAIVSYPAMIPSGLTRDQIITIMDWFPSILDWCNIPQDANTPRFDGRSVVPIIRHADQPSAHEVLYFGWSNRWAVRKGDWKLIGTMDPKTGTVAFTLHHLSEPNPEVNDHAQAQPNKVRELLELHQAWADAVKAQ